LQDATTSLGLMRSFIINYHKMIGGLLEVCHIHHQYHLLVPHHLVEDTSSYEATLVWEHGPSWPYNY